MADWPVRPPGRIEAPTIWRVDLALDHARLAADTALLSDAERIQAERYARAEDRRRYIGSHSALRRILAGALDTDLAAIAFETGAAGKPELAGVPDRWLRFNLSHSGGWALIGLSPSCAIGVDLEVLRPIADCMAVARGHFAPSEVAALATLRSEDRTEAFFACWTRKEAFVKATGLGLSMPLDRFAVAVPPETARLVAIEGDVAAAGRWSLHHLAPAPDHVGAVAMDDPDVCCVLHTLPP